MRVLGAMLAAAALASASPALALDTPKSGPSDPRIKIVDYDPWAVVKITGVFRTATQILLGPDETILHVAVGDATGWDVILPSAKACRASWIPSHLDRRTSSQSGVAS